MKAAAPPRDGKRIFYAPVSPYLVNACNQSRSAIDATLERLCKSGWLINLGRTRKKDGTETPNSYEVLEHPEWAARHPGCCPDYTECPDWETAKAYGVKVGDKLKSSGAIPENFLAPDSPLGQTSLGRGLKKILGNEPMLITDEELEAANKHLLATTHGAPGVVPLTVNENPLTVHPERATHGTQVLPVAVNEETHSRSTVRNPTTHNLENITHTHTHHTGQASDHSRNQCRY